MKFLSMVLRDFAAHGTLKEKYDVVAGQSDLGAKVEFGYRSNEVGFGWTNAAFLLLSDELSENGKRQLAQECGATSLGSRLMKDLTSARQ